MLSIQENYSMCVNYSEAIFLTKKYNINFQEVIEQNFETLQCPTGLKNRGGRLIILSNKYQLHDTYVGLNLSDINFRIFSIFNTEIQKQTKCFSSCPGIFMPRYYLEHIVYMYNENMCLFLCCSKIGYDSSL